MDDRCSVFIGRWQPFHEGHKWMIDQALSAGKRVAIGIRVTPVSEKNPYTVEERVAMIHAVYPAEVQEQRVVVFPIFDLTEVCVGRDVGYKITVLDPPPEIARVSASRVRSGDVSVLPPPVRRLLRLKQSTIWFTGLPASGKTTLAIAVKQRIEGLTGKPVVHLDGDELRRGLCSDLGYSVSDREENLRRAAWLCRHHNEAGRCVVASFVSPYRVQRCMIREILGPTSVLVGLGCALAVCEERDPKGMYRLARLGKIRDYTGISAPYEAADDADLRVRTDTNPVEACAGMVMEYLTEEG